MADDTTKKRISAELPTSSIETLKKLAQEQGATATSVIQSAIRTEEFLREEIKNNSKILIQRPDGTIKEIFFR